MICTGILHPDMVFDPVDPRQSFPDLEKGILQYWQEEDVFKRSIKKHCVPGDVLDTHGQKGCIAENFSFYDGPPFATGLPHYGHLLAGTIKDVIPRYQTMRGKKVERRFGWDCHGLPVENLVEQEQGLKSKKDIEAKGVRWFNDQCRSSVQRYTKEWRKTVERMGRWVDMDWDYRTMDPDFMESIWWAFQELWNKGLIYEGHKAMHICPRCVTPLSNFEVTLGYSDRTDLSTIATFPLVEDPNVVLLAWTTTTWSLPGDLWLGLGPNIHYVRVKQEGDDHTYIVAKKLVEEIFKGKNYEVMGDIDAHTLIGKKYLPLFDYFVKTPMRLTLKAGKPRTFGETAFDIIFHPEVSEEEGTGIVHFANTNAEDGFLIAKERGVDLLYYFGVDGRFYPEVRDFAGLSIKPMEGDPMATDKVIIKKLQEMGRLFTSYEYKHSYPHCWRCESPLLNYVGNSWFVAVEKIKQDILQQNTKTTWVPEHIRDGRFGQWLTNARDWAISRARYWGTPLPIWRCEETGEIEVIGSRDELMRKCPVRFTKLTVLRHAESEGNLTPIYQGDDPGTNLTMKGKKQAKEVARSLRASSATQNESRSFLRILTYWFSTRPAKRDSLEQNIHVIYTSPLARAQQTAEVIAKKTGAKIIIDPRLREVHFGEWEGKTVDFSDLTFVKERRAHKIEKGKPESIYHFEGMETWESVQERIKTFMEDILPKHRGEHVVVVTHADPVINIKHYFTKEDPLKLSHQPYPEKAKPYVYFFDHERNAALDLHKDTVDDLAWCSGSPVGAVEMTLVRHGETDWNKNRKPQGGDVDTSINETGRKQAEELAEQLKGKKFDVIISSTLKRATETADILADRLHILQRENWPEVRERMIGDWSGKDMEQIFTENPPASPSIKSCFLHHETPPNGESLSAFLFRVSNAIEKLVQEHAGKRVLLVTHGGTSRAFQFLLKRTSYTEAASWYPERGKIYNFTINPFMRRIPDVLDCWFESGSMPYAQSHYPFEMSGGRAPQRGAPTDPPGFPADFIAEGLDQTRGWFYTLMVLSTALFQKPAFRNCIVNGIVLAEDGKKMSKRLKNYPEPDLVMDKHGADAMRFTLMASPAVRGESLRFSEKAVEETVRRVILPLWNTYSFFILHANEAQWEPDVMLRSDAKQSEASRLEAHRAGGAEHPGASHPVPFEMPTRPADAGLGAPQGDMDHPLDSWIRAEVQDLANRMTKELDRYDLSATCSELYETLDALTNWYVRRSRRRFAGKEGDAERRVALGTLYDVLLTFSKVLAPFCPFITDAIYLNLVPGEHDSIHLSEWPKMRELTQEEKAMIQKTHLLRTIVSLGMGLRAEANVKVRQPLQKIEVALPQNLRTSKLSPGEQEILAHELNIKEVRLLSDASHLADRIVQVDARKAGPRLGGKVQEIIKAAKAGEFQEDSDGTIIIRGEKLSRDEASIVYRGKEGQAIASEKGVVIGLDTAITEELKLEGLARDIIRGIQALRKERDLKVSDRIHLMKGEGIEEVLAHCKELIEKETSGSFDQKEATLTVQISVEGEEVIVV